MPDLAKIDRALDEALVNLGTIVLRLADPRVTRTAEERRALEKSICQYAVCAKRSTDPRVLALRTQLQKTIEPPIRLVWSQ